MKWLPLSVLSLSLVLSLYSSTTSQAIEDYTPSIQSLSVTDNTQQYQVGIEGQFFFQDGSGNESNKGVNLMYRFNESDDYADLTGFGPDQYGDGNPFSATLPLPTESRPEYVYFSLCEQQDDNSGSSSNCSDVFGFPIPAYTAPADPDPEDPTPVEYPSYGYMVGVQVVIMASFFIITMIVGQYSPRSRR